MADQAQRFPTELPETPPTLCSYLTCPNNHRWFPDLAITTCPGCHGPILALRLQNCPICNEPSVQLTLRMDHTTRAIPTAPLCRGASTAAEAGTLEVPLTAWKTAENEEVPIANDQFKKLQQTLKTLREAQEAQEAQEKKPQEKTNA